jgi:hypothetical protein
LHNRNCHTFQISPHQPFDNSKPLMSPKSHCSRL